MAGLFSYLSNCFNTSLSLLFFSSQAPYGTTFTNTGAHTMSKGIVRSVYLLPVAAVTITHVVPQIFYSGAYASAPLTEATTGDFAVSVRVHISAPANIGSQASMLAVTAIGSWPNATAATQVRFDCPHSLTIALFHMNHSSSFLFCSEKQINFYSSKYVLKIFFWNGKHHVSILPHSNAYSPLIRRT
jgi:hypothetical protein